MNRHSPIASIGLARAIKEGGLDSKPKPTIIQKEIEKEESVSQFKRIEKILSQSIIWDGNLSYELFDRETLQTIFGVTFNNGLEKLLKNHDIKLDPKITGKVRLEKIPQRMDFVATRGTGQSCLNYTEKWWDKVVVSQSYDQLNKKENVYFKILKDIFKHELFSLDEVRNKIIGDKSNQMEEEIEFTILSLVGKGFLVSVKQSDGKIKYRVP